MKPQILAMDNRSARLGFPCGDPMCQDDDCTHVVLAREPGDADLELAPFWRACVVLGPHGDNLREHDKQDLMHRAMEEMDSREPSLADVLSGRHECAPDQCDCPVCLPALPASIPIPCGGCGATTNRERCIGCLHDFGTPDSAWVRDAYDRVRR